MGVNKRLPLQHTPPSTAKVLDETSPFPSTIFSFLRLDGGVARLVILYLLQIASYKCLHSYLFFTTTSIL
jgi:hypothetical protein